MAYRKSSTIPLTKSFSAMIGETANISTAITAWPIQLGWGRQSI